MADNGDKFNKQWFYLIPAIIILIGLSGAIFAWQKTAENMVVIGGFILSILLSVLFYSLARTRARAVKIAQKLAVKLAESEKYYRDMIESSPFAIALHDGQKVLYANRATLEMMGAEKPEQIIGKSIWEIVHPEYHKLAKERIKIETEQGKPVPLAEEKFIRLDKKIIDTEVAGAPTVFEGKPAVMVIMHDITDRKRKEKEPGTI